MIPAMEKEEIERVGGALVYNKCSSDVESTRICECSFSLFEYCHMLLLDSANVDEHPVKVRPVLFEFNMFFQLNNTTGNLWVSSIFFRVRLIT
ncbi:hypothetical protein L6452_34948 [Arctium lappa]|uniref:Uncharacterized protein n=1 Tax=Arctium lappa TaxID=4217 RepID=A0ACB8YKQ9_ARCLA|nr:hypothetical protein L6452_34948 [Arctium lappa]